MARVTPRLGLNVWDLTSDDFDHVELEANWDAIDAEIYVAKGFEILPNLPTTNNFPGRIVMLSSANGGFRAWTLCRYNGNRWAAIGSIEIHPSLPSNPYEGRMIVLSGADGGFDAWTLLRYAGADWRPLADLHVSANGTRVATRSKLNFITGSGISYTIADNAGNETIDITLDAEVAAALVKKNGAVIGNRSIINFVEGTDVTLDITSEASEINVQADVATPPAQPGTTLLDVGWRNESSNIDDRVTLTSGLDWVEYDVTDLKVDFTIPPSGQVLLVLTGNGAAGWPPRPSWGATTGGGSLVTDSDMGLAIGNLDRGQGGGPRISARRLVTGLTPGATTWYFAGRYNTSLSLGRFAGPASIAVFQVD